MACNFILDKNVTVVPVWKTQPRSL